MNIQGVFLSLNRAVEKINVNKVLKKTVHLEILRRYDIIQ